MKFACTDHIDHAIDDVVDVCNVAPEVSFVHQWKKADGETLDARCDYCTKRAKYLITHKGEAQSDE